MTRRKYVPVTPREHSPECRRHLPDAPSLDRERCERCRALWERLQHPDGPRHVSVRERS